MFHSLKSRFISDVEQPRLVRLGLFAGLRLNLNLHNQMQVFFGLWEREIYRFMRQTVPGCEWAVDVGSGRGEYTLFFLKQSGVQRAVAVDPLEVMVPMIQRNLELNGMADDLRLTRIEGFLGSTTDGRMQRLDDLGLDPNAPGFIKIDVDGGEVDVLIGGSALLAGGKARLLIETHSLELEQDCIRLLTAKGYLCRVIKNAWWRRLLHEERPTDHNRWLAATPA